MSYADGFHLAVGFWIGTLAFAFAVTLLASIFGWIITTVGGGK